MPNNKANPHNKPAPYTSFFQPRSLPTSRNADHTFSDKMDRLRELIYRAENSQEKDINLSEMRFRTGARAGSLQIMSQRIAA